MIETAMAMCLVATNVLSEAKQTDLFFDYSRKIRVNSPQQTYHNEARKTADETVADQQKAAVNALFEAIIDDLLESLLESHPAMTTSDLLSLSVELPNNATEFDELIGKFHDYVQNV